MKNTMLNLLFFILTISKCPYCSSCQYVDLMFCLLYTMDIINYYKDSKGIKVKTMDCKLIYFPM